MHDIHNWMHAKQLVAAWRGDENCTIIYSLKLEAERMMPPTHIGVWMPAESISVHVETETQGQRASRLVRIIYTIRLHVACVHRRSAAKKKRHLSAECKSALST
jgi:hypothetical protein